MSLYIENNRQEISPICEFDTKVYDQKLFQNDETYRFMNSIYHLYVAKFGENYLKDYVNYVPENILPDTSNTS